MEKLSKKRVFIFNFILCLVAAYIVLPTNQAISFSIFGRQINTGIKIPAIDFYFFGKHINPQYELKKGLDIQGGMQVILQADMSEIDPEDRENAIASSRHIIAKRVDLYGVNEPRIQTSKQGDNYRLIVELPGVKDQQQVLSLIGQTAQLEFMLESAKEPENEEQVNEDEEATNSAEIPTSIMENFKSVGLTGQELENASMQFNQQTGEPVVSLEFNDQGRDIFAQVTKENQGKVLAIFIDDFPVAMPVINSAILDGRAIMTGDFTPEKAENLAIQLRAGALPVPIEILEQKVVGASLGQDSVQKSIEAGLIGLLLVALFMILYYGFQGLIASLVLLIYALLTFAVYKVFGITLTLPGIAGMLLSIGMAVDSNILIFERIKEELRVGYSFSQAMEMGFGKAWDSIKDANLATILTALILINPLDFSFLNTSGLVRGFGVTLLIGVMISLFTGVVVSRNLLRISLPLYNKLVLSRRKKK